MGTADLGERELYQGLIKLAAAYVHGVRGNPLGTAKNLAGARARLAEARDEGFDGGLDLDDLIARIDERLAGGAAAAGAARRAAHREEDSPMTQPTRRAADDRRHRGLRSARGGRCGGTAPRRRARDLRVRGRPGERRGPDARCRSSPTATRSCPRTGRSSSSAPAAAGRRRPTAFLLRNGWTDVANVDGGTSAWERAGLPVNRGLGAALAGDRRASGGRAAPRSQSRNAATFSGWANAQPTNSRITKLPMPTPFAAR